MESILDGVVWGALGGLAGGLLGGLLSLIVVPKARPFVTIICVVGMVSVSRAITPLQAADMLGLEPVSDWLVERQLSRAQADIDALSSSDREMLTLVQELDPELYRELMAMSFRAQAANKDRLQAITEGRAQFITIVSERLPLLNDAELVTWSELMIRQHQVLAEAHNDWCMALAVSALPSHVESNDVPEEFNRLDLENMRLVLESDLEGGPQLDDEALQALVTPAVQSIFAQYGEDAVAVFTYFEDPSSVYPDNACQIFVDYLSLLNDGSGDSLGPLWRTMLAMDQ